MHLKSLKKGAIYLQALREKGETVGSVHTLGALHEGHGILIRQSATENQYTVVTVYPNKIQLFPGLRYKFDLKKDIELAYECGANAVISSTDKEMFPADYRTFIDQGISHSKLNSSIFSYAARGQITGSIRWLNFTRPNRSYFGMKDIEQAVLVKRAVKDLLMDCQIVHVPCIRFKNGVPISSRLMYLDPKLLDEVGLLYDVLNQARLMIFGGEVNTSKVLRTVRRKLAQRLKNFSLLYATIVDTVDFTRLSSARLPFIIHTAIRYKHLTHFDGLMITNSSELELGAPTIWLP